MKDEGFIQTIIGKGLSAKQKVIQEFSGLDVEILNWKQSPQTWSIVQCLDHLIQSHNAYTPIFERLLSGNYKMSGWEKWSPLTGFLGKGLVNQLKEEPKRKFKAPKKIQPSSSRLDPAIIDQYLQSLADFLENISRCNNLDVDRTVISSPTISIVTYSLRDAFQFLIQHEHRHINQAIRVKQQHLSTGIGPG